MHQIWKRWPDMRNFKDDGRHSVVADAMLMSVGFSSSIALAAEEGMKMLAPPSEIQKIKSRLQRVRAIRRLLSELGLVSTPNLLSLSKRPALFALAKQVRPRGVRK